MLLSKQYFRYIPPKSLGNSLSVWYTVNKTWAFVQSKSHVITLLGSLFLIINSNNCPVVKFIVWYKPLWSWWLPSCSSIDSLRYKDFDTRPPSWIRVCKKWNRKKMFCLIKVFYYRLEKDDSEILFLTKNKMNNNTKMKWNFYFKPLLISYHKTTHENYAAFFHKSVILKSNVW